MLQLQSFIAVEACLKHNNLHVVPLSLGWATSAAQADTSGFRKSTPAFTSAHIHIGRNSGAVGPALPIDSESFSVAAALARRACEVRQWNLDEMGRGRTWQLHWLGQFGKPH